MDVKSIGINSHFCFTSNENITKSAIRNSWQGRSENTFRDNELFDETRDITDFGYMQYDDEDIDIADDRVPFKNFERFKENVGTQFYKDRLIYGAMIGLSAPIIKVIKK